MESIELRILEYINNKGTGNSAIFPFLELYLMSKYREDEYKGIYLINKVKEMENDGLVKISNLGIFITPEGIEYLNNHQ